MSDPFRRLRFEVTPAGVATVALNEPATRNALSPEVLTELLEALERVRADERARVVVLASTHPTVFSSGGNLANFSPDTPAQERSRHNALFPRVFLRLAELGKPSICAAGGHVLAGALGLALACDLVVARESARFGTPEINVGLFPFMVTALLQRNIGRKRMAELVLLGEQISATEAERIGLINRVVPDGEFDAAVEDWAGRLAAKSPLMMRLGKDAMLEQDELDLVSALEALQSQLTFAQGSEDAREGIAAFFEKRAPRWSGR